MIDASVGVSGIACRSEIEGAPCARSTGSPVSGDCTIRSTPQTRLAISSRNSDTSSSGSLSRTCVTTGGTTNTSARADLSADAVSPNMLHPPGWRVGPIDTVRPNVSLTSSRATRITLPAATSTGSTNQSTP